MTRSHLHAATLFVAPLLIVLTMRSNLRSGEAPPSTYPPVVESVPVAEPSQAEPVARPAVKPARKAFKMPGLVVDFQQRCVDIEGSICLDQGFLELIACVKGSKEHESIVAITARPMHIHTALLLLDANRGHPAMRKAIDEQETRWVDVPPRGDPVDVYLAFKNREGKAVEHPISDFVARSEETPDGTGAGGNNEDAGEKFPHTFLFAGSHLRDDGPGPRKYLCEQSGNVISIATFGDELLCLPGVHGQANDALMWRIDATKLPAVGSKVTLRLRPKRQPALKAGKAAP